MVAAAGLWINQFSIFLVAAAALYAGASGCSRSGIGWIVASLHVFLRDTAQMLSVVLTFWFWVTPVLFRRPVCESPVPAGRQPDSYLVRAYRDILLSTAFPSWRDLAIVRCTGPSHLFSAACSSAT